MGARRNKIIVGERYGRLVVLSLSHKTKPGRYYIEYKCDCGAIKAIKEDCVKTGNTKSCGCFSKDTRGANRTHGMHDTRVYKIWHGMISRCKRPSRKSHLYLDKGIKVCDDWLSFESFYRDMGDPPNGYSIDRIDGNLGYNKENCRWANALTQANNTSANRNLEYNGKKQSISAWAREIKIKPNTLFYRIKRGWPVERALTTQ